jgi:hypothetical protein
VPSALVDCLETILPIGTLPPYQGNLKTVWIDLLEHSDTVPIVLKRISGGGCRKAAQQFYLVQNLPTGHTAFALLTTERGKLNLGDGADGLVSDRHVSPAFSCEYIRTS